MSTRRKARLTAQTTVDAYENCSGGNFVLSETPSVSLQVSWDRGDERGALRDLSQAVADLLVQITDSTEIEPIDLVVLSKGQYLSAQMECAKCTHTRKEHPDGRCGAFNREADNWCQCEHFTLTDGFDEG